MDQRLTQWRRRSRMGNGSMTARYSILEGNVAEDWCGFGRRKGSSTRRKLAIARRRSLKSAFTRCWDKRAQLLFEGVQRSDESRTRKGGWFSVYWVFVRKCSVIPFSI